MPSIKLRLNKTLQIVSKTCQLVAEKSTTQQQNKKKTLYHKTINRCLVTYKSLKIPQTSSLSEHSRTTSLCKSFVNERTESCEKIF